MFINVSLGNPFEEVTIRTYNFSGQLVKEERSINTDLLRMDITSLNEGTYYAIVMTPTNRGVFRFVKS